ncbi:odorant receptor 13a-like isoform X2 [Anoplolepis gracilipes]|uniref:odorant receptor 13a-like isoform X2 n=1 Tax=Anoplolepis gracilipes TaxID=354296 RepID=UPI003B9FD049
MLMLDNLQFVLPAVSCSIRIIIFWWKKEAIVPIMGMIAEDWIRSKSVRERRMMIRRARSARLIIKCAYCIMVVGCFFVVVLPGFGVSMRLTSNITDPGRPLPLQTHYVYDVTKRPQYELTFVSQAVYVILAIITYTGIDHFLSLLVFHICGQLDILQDRLTHLYKYINSHDMLRSCVAKHIRLLRAIDIIEDTYNITLLALFMYFVILFAFYGFRIISLFDEGNDMSLAHLVYFISTVFNLFIHMCLYCALGEFLVAKCNEIYYAAYSNEWYLVDSKNSRNLLPLLIRGAKPIYLTAGKVFPMTMATFCGLIEKGSKISISHLMYEVCIVINVFGHMCLYCAVGEILVNQCNQIHYAVYNYKWYTLDSRNARGLIFLMIRSSKPIYLTAGKVFPMTMATFCNLIKTSASYISVLLTTKV